MANPKGEQKNTNGNAKAEKAEQKSAPKMKKPDKADLDQKINVIQAEITTQENESKDIRGKIDKILNDRSGSRTELDDAQNAMKTLIAERKQISADKTALGVQRDAARDKIIAKQNAEKAAKAELKFTNPEAIDKQIRELETRQARTTMSLNDEKKIIKDIKALQQSKKAISALSDMRAEIDAAKLAKEDIDKTYSEKLSEFKNVNDRITAQREVLDKLNKDNASQKDAIPGLRQRQTDVRNAINENYKKMKTLRAEFKAACDAFNVYMTEERARFKEQKQKEAEARKAAEEEYRKQLEAEELARIPYEEEQLLCDSLVSYLETNFPPEKAESGESASTAAVEIEGMSLFKREDDVFLKVDGGKKTGRGKKKGGANSKKELIVHGVDTIKSFSLIGVVPPTTSAGVAQTIDQLKARKEYYKGLERGAIPSIASTLRAERENAQAQQEKSKKSPQKSVFNLEADFPDLAITEGASANAEPATA